MSVERKGTWTLLLFVALGGTLPADAGTTYRDRTQELGLNRLTNTQGRTFIEDLNGDNRPDTFLPGHNVNPQILLFGRPDGTFAAAPQNPFCTKPGCRDYHSCAVADFASMQGGQDGKPDFFCHKGADGGSRPQPKDLWVGTSSGTFINLAAQRGLGSISVDRGRDGLPCHLNGDTVPDLCTAALGSSDANDSFSRAFSNNGGFSRRSRSVLQATRQQHSRVPNQWPYCRRQIVTIISFTPATVGLLPSATLEVRCALLPMPHTAALVRGSSTLPT